MATPTAYTGTVKDGRLISLTQGFVALVDEEDFLRFGHLRWHVRKEGRSIYAARGVTSGGKKMFYLHREILGAEDGQLVDHINGDGLDNRRCNLRICDRMQNGMNRAKNRNTQCAFKGVSKRGNRFRAIIQVRKRRINIGTFATEIEAAEAYNAAASEYFGHFARLNEV